MNGNQPKQTPLQSQPEQKGKSKVQQSKSGSMTENNKYNTKKLAEMTNEEIASLSKEEADRIVLLKKWNERKIRLANSRLGNHALEAGMEKRMRAKEAEREKWLQEEQRKKEVEEAYKKTLETFSSIKIPPSSLSAGEESVVVESPSSLTQTPPLSDASDQIGRDASNQSEPDFSESEPQQQQQQQSQLPLSSTTAMKNAPPKKVGKKKQRKIQGKLQKQFQAEQRKQNQQSTVLCGSNPVPNSGMVFGQENTLDIKTSA